ncbi:MAG: avidin/streptavidin family protein [bacterium]
MLTTRRTILNVALMCCGLAGSSAVFATSPAAGPITFSLSKGQMANYGATPWYTSGISVGSSQLNFALDSGANFIWATSDQCTTDACNNHSKVSSSQTGFSWVNSQPAVRSFGPWGSMTTMTGQVASSSPPSASTIVNQPVFLSTSYEGNKFGTLDWGGGIGFPSRSDAVEPGSGFYMGYLVKNGLVSQASFSTVTEPTTGAGAFLIGGDDTNLYLPASKITLPPDTTGTIPYIWGTRLYSASLAAPGDLPSLNNARFYLDSGSSVFKGDAIYLQAILEKLYAYNDPTTNQPIFTKIMDGDSWVGLAFPQGKTPADYPNLPSFTLTMGTSCNDTAGQSAQITLSPTQYSIYVEEGDQAGQWVAAFTVLDGVGGLLVGSTFMDLFYTSFSYEQNGDTLTQGDMALYKKASGTHPSAVSCVAQPATSPVTGTWYNSYCSQMMLVADTTTGEVSGSYTSHTGSTGTSAVNGWAGTASTAQGGPYGTPLALGIQWRLNNQPATNVDPTWHWVSSFSGQYHPAQTVSEAGQADFQLPETITIMNALVATANLAGYTTNAPVMWPETLEFTRNPPAYCEPIPPTTEIPYTGTSSDYISGTWISDSGEAMGLQASVATGVVNGVYFDSSGKSYSVTGNMDNLPIDSSMAQQGVALTMRDEDGTVFSFAGGTNLNGGSPLTMSLWQDSLTSTTWTGRFTESTLNQKTFTYLPPIFQN